MWTASNIYGIRTSNHTKIFLQDFKLAQTNLKFSINKYNFLLF